GGQQAQSCTSHCRQQGADRGNGQGLQGAIDYLAQPAGGGVRREEGPRILLHLVQPIAAEQGSKIQLQPAEGSDDRREQQRDPQHHFNMPLHASRRRNRLLSWSAASTRSRKVSNMVT